MSIDHRLLDFNDAGTLTGKVLLSEFDKLRVHQSEKLTHFISTGLFVASLLHLAVPQEAATSLAVYQSDPFQPSVALPDAMKVLQVRLSVLEVAFRAAGLTVRRQAVQSRTPVLLAFLIRLPPRALHLPGRQPRG